MIPLFLVSLVVGLVVGVLAGLLGIGGGMLLVPAFKLGYAMDSLMCTATSLFTIIPTSVSGAISHIRNKTCLPKLGVAAGLGGACLSPLGVWLATLSPDWAVMGAAALIIAYSSVTMFRKALKAPKVPRGATGAEAADAAAKEAAAEDRAAAIERARAAGPIETTGALVEIIRGALPAAALREKQHPAKRSFQGIRIAVNDELTAISRMLQAAIPRLKTGGRLAVISFHSLEDRIVKSELAAAAKGCDCPPSFPVCVCGKRPLVRLVNRKPILPSQAEQEENPRARSAKLRVAEKLEG